MTKQRAPANRRYFDQEIRCHIPSSLFRLVHSDGRTRFLSHPVDLQGNNTVDQWVIGVLPVHRQDKYPQISDRQKGILGNDLEIRKKKILTGRQKENFP